jgi:hypothetical protein
MKLIEIGSKWWGGKDKTFEVTDVKEQDGNNWVYYMNVDTSQEYSCFAEAFLERFTGLPK